MSTNLKVKNARIAKGLTEAETASMIGMKLPSYYDLEAAEDEIYAVLSLDEVFKLCRVLSIRPSELFGKSQCAANFNLERLQSETRAAFYASNLSLEEFGNHVGWDVTALLQDKYNILEWSVDGLKDLARVIKRDWLGMVVSIYAEWGGDAAGT